MSTELRGRHFTLPHATCALDRGDRAALAFVTGGAVRIGDDVIENSMAPGAVDLSLVHAGRCPLLMEHHYRLDALLGQVVAAEVHGSILRCIVKFARGPDPDRLWDWLAGGMPLSLSVGARIEHAVAAGPGLWRVERWRLMELSLVVFGRDEAAHVRALGQDEDAAAMVARMNAANGGEARAAVRNNLRLDEWERWAVPTGVRLAEKLGVDNAAVCESLSHEVRQRCEQFVADLAA